MTEIGAKIRESIYTRERESVPKIERTKIHQNLAPVLNNFQ